LLFVARGRPCANSSAEESLPESTFRALAADG
jgi:hypothetical protein